MDGRADVLDKSSRSPWRRILLPNLEVQINFMKALILSDFNKPFELVDIDRPKPGPGEVLVKISASGVNPLDLKIRAGQAAHAKAKLPGVFGIDMAGVVAELGEGVEGFQAGDEVYGMTGGNRGCAGIARGICRCGCATVGQKAVQYFDGGGRGITAYLHHRMGGPGGPGEGT